jgi:hypothetical protein
MLVLATVLIGALIVSAADDAQIKQENEKVYGTQSSTTIAVIVSSAFNEEGIHYIPVGTKFLDFIKSIHMRPGFDPVSSIHVKRNGKKVTDTYRTTPEGKEKRDRFVLEGGDIIERSFYNW